MQLPAPPTKPDGRSIFVDLQETEMRPVLSTSSPVHSG